MRYCCHAGAEAAAEPLRKEVRPLPTARILALAVLAFLLAGPAAQEAAAQPVTTQECENSWSSAPAYLDCTTRHTEILEVNGQCNIKALCPFLLPNNPTPQLRTNDKTVLLADMDDLHNCNGHLTVGSC